MPTPEEIAAAAAAAAATTPPAVVPAAAAEPDDDEPEEPAAARTVLGRGGQPMNEDAIADRARRERNRVLREEYGTHDPDKIKVIKQQRAADAAASKTAAEELARYKEQDAERERASMTETDRMKADLATANAKIEELTNKLKAKEQSLLQTKQSAQLGQLAASHKIKAKAVRLLEQDLATHYNSLTKPERARFDQRAIDRWVRRWASDNPEYVTTEAAPAAAAPATETPAAAAPAARPPLRRPLGSRNAPPAKVQPATRAAASPDVDPATGKTLKPGQKNSMNHAEAQAFLAKQGRKLPYGGTSQKFQPRNASK